MPASHAQQVCRSISLAYLLPCPTPLEAVTGRTRAAWFTGSTLSHSFTRSHTRVSAPLHRSTAREHAWCKPLFFTRVAQSARRARGRTLTETLGPVGGAVTNVDTWPKVPVTARACPQLTMACRYHGRGFSAEGRSGCACSSCTWLPCGCHGFEHPATCPGRRHLAKILGRCARAQTPC